MDRLSAAIHEFSLLSDEIVDRAPTLPGGCREMRPRSCQDYSTR